MVLAVQPGVAWLTSRLQSTPRHLGHDHASAGVEEHRLLVALRLHGLARLLEHLACSGNRNGARLPKCTAPRPPHASKRVLLPRLPPAQAGPAPSRAGPAPSRSHARPRRPGTEARAPHPPSAPPPAPPPLAPPPQPPLRTTRRPPMPRTSPSSTPVPRQRPKGPPRAARGPLPQSRLPPTQTPTPHEHRSLHFRPRPSPHPPACQDPSPLR